MSHICHLKFPSSLIKKSKNKKKVNKSEQNKSEQKSEINFNNVST